MNYTTNYRLCALFLLFGAAPVNFGWDYDVAEN